MTELTEQISTTQNKIPPTKGKLQNRITLLLVAILIPILILYAWFDITAQRRNLEALLLERAEAAATSGATTVGSFLNHALESNELTKDELFDTNYQEFWEFNPAIYPDFTGDPDILAKYHTEYDAYTDEHLQEVLDSFLGGEDLIFAVASDRNGYVPTHNSISSTGDGDPATDRTKRIFDDPVGIKASRNTEPIIQQVYEQSGTEKTFWDVSAPIYVDGEHWGAFRVGVELTQNQERVIAATWQTIIGFGLVILLVALFSLLVGRYVSAPIVQLTGVAAQATTGDLNQRVTIENRQEITTLAQAFNIMTSQLRGFIENLEARVTARTQDLNLAADIGRQVSQARNIDEVLDEATTSIKDQFDLYQVQIYLTNPSQDSLVLRASDGFAGSRLLKTGHTLPLDENSLNGSAAYNKQAVIVKNTRENNKFRPHPLLPDTRSEMVVPLLVEDDVLGVIDLQSAKANALTEDILPAFTVLAGQLSIAIMNARRNRAMQENQQLMRTIIDASPDWIFVKDHDHRYQLVNQAYANSFHLSPDEFVGKNDLDLGFPEEIVKGNAKKGIRGFWADDREIMNSGQMKVIPEEPGEVDGQPVVLQTVKAPLMDADGNAAGIVGFVQDITNRKQAEETIAKRADELQAVAELSTAVSTITDSQQLLQAVVDLTKQRFSLYHAHIYLVDEAEETLVLTAGAGEAGKIMVAEGLSIPLNQEQSLVSRAARNKKGVIVNDVVTDTGFLPNPLLPHTRSEMAIPIIIGSDVLGVLDVQADSKDRFSDQDIQIQTTLASQTAVALQNARQFEQTQQAIADVTMFRQLADASDQGISITTLHGEPLYINQSLAQILQLENVNDIFSVNTLGELYPTEVHARFQEEMVPALMEQGVWQDEMWLGSQEHPIVTAQNHFLLKDDSGKPTHAAAVITDITDQKETENTIRANQTLMRTIIDTSSDQIIVKSRENRFLLVNQAFANVVGKPVDDIIGKNDIEIGRDKEEVKGNPEKGIIGYWPEDQAVMMDGQPIVIENVNEEGNSNKIMKTPLKDKDGTVTGLVIFVQDITAEKRGEVEQRKLAQAFEEQLTQVNALQRAMTRDNWGNYIEDQKKDETGFSFAGESVEPFDSNSIEAFTGGLPIDLEMLAQASYDESQTAVTLPLQLHGESIGVIGARNANGDPINAEQQALLTTLTAQVAESLDRARLFEETETARSQTEALFTGSENVVRATSLEDILASFVEATPIKNMDRVSLLFFNQVWQDSTPESAIVAATWRNKNVAPLVATGTTYTFDTYPLLQFLRKDAPYVIEDFKTFPDLDDNSRRLFIEGLGISTAITIPLVAGDQWIGYILGLSTAINRLSQSELRQISSLAGQAATVAQSQRLYQEASSRAEREQILRQVSDRVYAAPDAETVLRTAAREIGQALGLETFIYLEDELEEEENLPTTE